MRFNLGPAPVPAPRCARTLDVISLSPASARGFITLGRGKFPCAIGRAGRRTRKREGDGATPIGRWRLVQVLYRPDRVRRPRTTLPVRPLRPSDGWCDAPGDRNYNRPVCHPYPASAEELWRKDGLYDVVIVLDHNQHPRVRGLGSAIFMHVASPGFTPTSGCIALTRHDLLRLLTWVGPRAFVRVRP